MLAAPAELRCSNNTFAQTAWEIVLAEGWRNTGFRPTSLSEFANPCMRLQEVVFGLPKLAPRLSQGLVQSQLLPVYRKLAADRVWLVRAAAASTLPAIAGFLPSGIQPYCAIVN